MIAKYFWDLNKEALRETTKIVRDPGHPQFAQRMTALLSRCDKPTELFSILSREKFIEAWPAIQSYWARRVRRSDSRDWWQTLYEQLLEKDSKVKIQGKPFDFLRHVGTVVQEARIRKGLSQGQLALRIGMKQPDISRIEEGKKNITLFTLMRLCKVLGIKRVNIA